MYLILYHTNTRFSADRAFVRLCSESGGLFEVLEKGREVGILRRRVLAFAYENIIMQCTIHKNVESQRVINILPQQYRKLVNLHSDLSTRYTLLVFRNGRDDVIVSRVVQQALETLDSSDGQQRFAIGGCFTAEAHALLREQHIEAYTLSDFYWTDQSHSEHNQR